MRTAYASLAFVLCMAWSSGSAGFCRATSGPQTLPLVELYTASTCDACRPAERWLAERRGVAAITLHMDLLDYGAPEARVRQRVDRRQYGLAKARRVIVTSPRVLVQGRQIDWEGPEADDVLRRESQRPEAAHIEIALERSPADLLNASIRVEMAPAESAGARLFYAGFRRRTPLSSTRGTPPDASSILQWSGPVEIPADGRLMHVAAAALPPGDSSALSGVVAYVESGPPRRVVQAAMLQRCRDAGVR